MFGSAGVGTAPPNRGAGSSAGDYLGGAGGDALISYQNTIMGAAQLSLSTT
jgi:hypothetical protein